MKIFRGKMASKKEEPRKLEDIELSEELIEVTPVQKEEEKEMTNKNEELELLKAQVAELQALLGKTTPVVEKKKIQADDYIPVMSLLPHTLNLSTKGGGQGTLKKFTKFGEVKNIMYRDLVDIVDAHHNFVEAGYFYILNEEVIRRHGLLDIYDNILTKEKIEQIIETKDEEAFDLYKSANPQQKEIIIELLTDKVFDNPDSVNLNIVDKISRDSGVNIQDKAKDRREMMKIRQEEEEGK